MDRGPMRRLATCCEGGPMIRASHLTKHFDSVRAVDDLSFVCRAGTITALLGPNGAGKSTTMAMALGLTFPTSGTVTVAGQPYRALSNPGRVVGAVLDASAHHPGRSGITIVASAARTIGVPPDRVAAVLDEVGLTETDARRRFGDYSLGMRQRLGLAVALIGDPSVLVLDEPSNGLDPAGQLWLRGFLRNFADRGGTVVVATHQLAEVERTADDVVVVDHGRCVAAGAVKDLAADRGLEDAYLAATGVDIGAGEVRS